MIVCTEYGLVDKSLDALVKKWTPVIESDIGEPLLDDSDRKYVALLLEVQRIFNQKHIGNCKFNIYGPLQAYTLPLVRRYSNLLTSLTPYDLSDNMVVSSVMNPVVSISLNGLHKIDPIYDNTADEVGLDDSILNTYYNCIEGYAPMRNWVTCDNKSIIQPIFAFIIDANTGLPALNLGF